MNDDIIDLSTMKKKLNTVVFNFDALSQPLTNKDKERTLSFPAETKYIFKLLDRMGINIKITSSSASIEDIKICLQDAELLEFFAYNDFLIQKKEQSLVDVLNAIKKAEKVDSEEICLVDTEENGEIAKKEKFDLVQFKDNKFFNPIYLYELLAKCDLNKNITQAAKEATQSLADLQNDYEDEKIAQQFDEIFNNFLNKCPNALFKPVGNSNVYYTEIVDVSICPTPLEDSFIGEPTIGDLHGSTIKLIYFLAKNGVLKISQNEYDTLKAIYRKNLEDLTKNDLDQFELILNNLKVGDKKVDLSRLLGDDFCDRGQNDYFTLLVFQKLKKEGFAIESLLSNHSIELIENYERKGNFSPRVLKRKHATSMHNLQLLIENKLVTEEKVRELIKDVYMPAVEPISYSLSEDEKEITLFAHACIGIQTIKGMAKKLGIKYEDKTARKLANTIEQIRKKFKEYKDKEKIHQLYSSLAMHNGYEGSIPNGDCLQYPFESLMWSRKANPNDRPEFHNGYKIVFVHGHDSADKTQKNIINIDNTLCKGDSDSETHYKGEYTIVCSHGKKVKLEQKKPFNLVKDNIRAIKSKPEFAEDIAESLHTLAKFGLLNDVTRKWVVDNANITINIMCLLTYLHQNNLLSENYGSFNFDLLVEKYQADPSIKYALSMMDRFEILTQENFETICNNQSQQLNAHDYAFNHKDIWVKNKKINDDNIITLNNITSPFKIKYHNELYNAYGNSKKISNVYGNDRKISNDLTFCHSRTLSAKRLAALAETDSQYTLVELRLILKIEYMGIHLLPSLDAKYKSEKFLPQPIGKQTFFNAPLSVLEHFIATQFYKIDKLLISNLTPLIPSAKSGTPSDNLKTKLAQVQEHGAHVLLSYVNSRECSLKHKLFHAKDFTDSLSQRIIEAGNFAHMLLLCKNAHDFNNFKSKAKMVIDKFSQTNSHLCHILREISSNIDSLVENHPNTLKTLNNK